ncbi:hypothetical protein DFH09DRAFT_1422688 [Mycena vulgaris]|nr:hypothetical protein DFH09DRAFT_1422688 [Mycena vulgaris]
MLLLLLSSTAQFGLDLATTFKPILLLPRAKLNTILERWTTLINFMICDFIVIWRASVLGSQRRAVRVTLWVIGSANLVFAICMAAAWSRDVSKNSPHMATTTRLNTIVNFGSHSTTLIGTGVVAISAWGREWRIDPASSKNGVSISVGMGVIWALVQVVFSILQKIVAPVDSELSRARDVAAAAFWRVALYLAAILCTAVVIITRSRSRGAIEDPMGVLHFDLFGPGTEQGTRDLLQAFPRKNRRDASSAAHQESQPQTQGAADTFDEAFDARGFAMADRAALMPETRTQRQGSAEESPPDYRSDQSYDLVLKVQLRVAITGDGICNINAVRNEVISREQEFHEPDMIGQGGHEASTTAEPEREYPVCQCLQGRGDCFADVVVEGIDGEFGPMLVLWRYQRHVAIRPEFFHVKDARTGGCKTSRRGCPPLWIH